MDGKWSYGTPEALTVAGMGGMVTLAKTLRLEPGKSGTSRLPQTLKAAGPLQRPVRSQRINTVDASTWGEFNFGTTQNSGWSGFDVSMIQAQHANLEVQGMKICSLLERSSLLVYH